VLPLLTSHFDATPESKIASVRRVDGMTEISKKMRSWECILLFNVDTFADLDLMVDPDCMKGACLLFLECKHKI
jgi:hypothetical protein